MEVTLRTSGTEYDRVLLWQLFLLMAFSKWKLLYFSTYFFLFVYHSYVFVLSLKLAPLWLCQKINDKERIEFIIIIIIIITKTVISPSNNDNKRQ